MGGGEMSTVAVTRFALGAPAPWAGEIHVPRDRRATEDDLGGVKWTVDRRPPTIGAPQTFAREHCPEPAWGMRNDLASMIGSS